MVPYWVVLLGGGGGGGGGGGEWVSSWSINSTPRRWGPSVTDGRDTNSKSDWDNLQV